MRPTQALRGHARAGNFGYERAYSARFGDYRATAAWHTHSVALGRVVLLASLLGSGACSGRISAGFTATSSRNSAHAPKAGGAAGQNATGGSSNDPGQPVPPAGPSVPGIDRSAECKLASVRPTLVRRLSHVEYTRTLADLLPGVTVPPLDLITDLPVHGFENNATQLNPSTVLIEQYADAAAAIAQVAAAEPSAILPCTPQGNDMGCATDFIKTFGMRAFRRPLTAEEQARYEGFFAQQMIAISWNGALELTLQALLQAPQFLYRLELSGDMPTDGAGVALDDYEMASRLSYFLWQSMPDDQLFAAAQRGELHTAQQVEAQARRMIEDPRGVAGIVDFHRQWLDFDRVNSQNKDPMLFPDWNDTLRQSMREEVDRFVGYVFSDGGGTLAELLTSTTTFANKPLADLYGVPISGTDWQMASLPGDQRSGLLTRADFLASRAHTTNGSPPLRGVSVLDELLCNRPPPPPPNADTSTPTGDPSMPKTNRQLFEERTAPATCQACHQTINGLGYGFEHYDSIGRYRTTDNGLPVDAKGSVMGTDADGSYDGALELSQRLAGSDQVNYCMVRNWYRYAFARDDAIEDWCKLDSAYAAVQAHGGDIRELLVSLATSYEFMHRPATAL